ncbi:MAG: LOG family protein [Rhodospirillales bacterium]
MDDEYSQPVPAYLNPRFVESRDGRPIRILSEYLEPAARFRRYEVSDTIVFYGSARIVSREQAEKMLNAARVHKGDVAAAERALDMSRYYEDARELAHRLTDWSKSLEGTERRFVVCTGGGPGIMEAANRGASEAAGMNVGLNIKLPFEQHENPHITRELTFEFNYFFMRKFWFMYLAKTLVIFPGGFGTLDELFEAMTLVTTGKLHKKMPVILYGTDYWDDVMDLDAMVRHGTILPDELDAVFRTNSVDDAFNHITRELTDLFLEEPGGRRELA